jgi:NitT/TauT family transport system substrate-binding protein
MGGICTILRRAVLGALALIGATLAPAPACAQQPAAQLSPWRHGVLEAKSDAGFVFMASRGGFAEQQGLKVDMLQFKGDALALKALIAGELDTYEGSPGGPMLAASNGADIKLLGCYWPILTYGIFAKAGIASPHDLRGKVLAISAPGALPDLLARAVLEKNDVPASEVRFSIMGSDADRFRALTAGVVDAAAASTEFVPITQSGVKLLVHAYDAVPDYVRLCVYAGGKTLTQRRDELVRFLAAQMAGVRHALMHRDEAIRLAKEVTEAKADDPRAGYIFDEVVRYAAVTPEMPVPMDKLAWMRELLTKTGNLSKPLDLAKFTDDGPRAKALELVGK